MFVDKATVVVKAGNGGNGAVSFRHEIYVDKGGPDGGNGGRGGDVVFIADANTDTLVDFRYNPELKATNGESGGKRQRNGKRGRDLEVNVPLGTVVLNDNQVIADFIKAGQRVVIARGGDGGFGNAHFKSSTRQTPRVAEKGEPGDEFELQLELKLIADVGLVGLPNAGKSTFLSVVTNAKPEIADYAFTTLTPHLGVADIDKSSILIADIPGLIEGASSGKGLGHEFLRHIERTGVILHLIDAYNNDIGKAYNIIRDELKLHDKVLAKVPEVVAITKTEGLDEDIVEDIIDQLVSLGAKKSLIFAISSQAHKGLLPLLRKLKSVVDKEKLKATTEGSEVVSEKHIFTLNSDTQAWQVTKLDVGKFKITGHKIEKFARRTDFEDYHGRQRLRDIMKKMGIAHELRRQGVESTSKLYFGNYPNFITLIEQED
jgi:GTP-binding protein